MKRLGSTAAVQEILLLFSAVFGPLAFGCVEPWSVTIMETVLFLMFFFLLFRKSLPQFSRSIERSFQPCWVWPSWG